MGATARGRRIACGALLAALSLSACAGPSDRPVADEALLQAAPPPTFQIVPPPPSSAVTPPAGTTPPAATSGTPAPAATSAPSRRAAAPALVGPAGRTLATLVTYYSAYDNDPPGSRAIAHPNARHSQAGGVGTFADPITMATDPREIPVGTIVYYPALKKYFVMEDDCESCIGEWAGGRTYHIDLFMGNGDDDAVTACQHALTPDGRVNVELGAPAGRPVDTTPLYANGRCLG